LRRVVSDTISALKLPPWQQETTECASVIRVFLEAPMFQQCTNLLKQIFGSPVALANSTTYIHSSSIPILTEVEDVLLFDANVHRSVQVALSSLGSKYKRFPIQHNSFESWKRSRNPSSLVRSEFGSLPMVSSMTGELLDLEHLNELTIRYPRLFAYIDDAHGTSWAGKHGRGLVLEFGLPRERTFVACSLSKGFGTSGSCDCRSRLPNKAGNRSVGPAMIFAIQMSPH
jgi:7-keto-8-aminopelargonate synthetase-like enzyme